MDYLLPLLSGIVAKIYDDLHDNNLLNNDMLKESLKGSQWILLTLLSYNDFNFSIIAYFANVLTVFSNWKEWDYPYEKSLLILYPFLILLSFPTRKMFSVLEILLMLGIGIGMWIEPYSIDEEYSYRKFIQRIIQTIFSILSLGIVIYFDLSSAFLKLMLFSIGYNFVSSLFQYYLINKEETKKSNASDKV